MPYDWDARWAKLNMAGLLHNALYDHADIPDSPTWQFPDKTAHRSESNQLNAIRELEDPFGIATAPAEDPRRHR